MTRKHCKKRISYPLTLNVNDKVVLRRNYCSLGKYIENNKCAGRDMDFCLECST